MRRSLVIAAAVALAGAFAGQPSIALTPRVTDIPPSPPVAKAGFKKQSYRTKKYKPKPKKSRALRRIRGR